MIAWPVRSFFARPRVLHDHGAAAAAAPLTVPARANRLAGSTRIGAHRLRWQLGWAFLGSIANFYVPVAPANAEGLNLLHASGPADSHKAELMQFGRLVGSWSLDIHIYDAKGAELRHASGRWQFGWVLEGRAVQDVFIVYAPNTRSDDPNKTTTEYGTTLSVFDDKIDAWRVVYAGPKHGQMLEFVARAVGDDMILQRQEEDGSLTHWTFSAIRPESFRWTATTSRDGGKTWTTDQIMTATRAAAT